MRRRRGGSRLRLALQRPQLHLETLIEPPYGFEEASRLQVGLGVIGIQPESPFEAALCADPVPVASEEHRAQRDLRVGARIVHRQRTERGGAWQATDLVAMAKPITKYSALIRQPERLPEMMRSAFRAALTGTPLYLAPESIKTPDKVAQFILRLVRGELNHPSGASVDYS